jgi:hypothetical protein
MMGGDYDDLWKRSPHKWSLPKHTYVFMSRESKRERENGEELGLWNKGLGLISMWCEVALRGELGLSTWCRVSSTWRRIRVKYVV